MKKSIAVFHWLPRILCILAILFVSMFALDSFSPDLTIWQQVGGFLMHLIPSYVLIALLIIAWKWENIGGILFTIVGLGLSPFVFMMNYKRTHFAFWPSFGIILMITFPFIVVGILFIVSYYKKKRNLRVK